MANAGGRLLGTFSRGLFRWSAGYSLPLVLGFCLVGLSWIEQLRCLCLGSSDVSVWLIG